VPFNFVAKINCTYVFQVQLYPGQDANRKQQSHARQGKRQVTYFSYLYFLESSIAVQIPRQILVSLRYKRAHSICWNVLVVPHKKNSIDMPGFLLSTHRLKMSL
jgi:hypothetical protein